MKPEREAIARLKDGDIGGLRTLVELHQHYAVRAATVITRDQQLAEDVVSGCFLTVYERIAQFDDQREFRPWFYRIVVNAALKAVKRQSRLLPWEWVKDGRGRNSPIPRNEVALSLDYPEKVVETREVVEQLRSEIRALTAKQRAVIVLRYDLDMSEKEISEMLRIPRGTVKSRASAAIRRLRESMTRLFA